MDDVMGMQTPRRAAAGHHTRAVAMLQRAAQPAADGAGDSPGANGLAVALQPHFAAGITGHILAVGVRQ